MLFLIIELYMLRIIMAGDQCTANLLFVNVYLGSIGDSEL